ncbi:MAG: sodium:calcium antiporter [Chloroflexota bacterium]|nr:sodium:calcium antiporter [Chloroflexota bacterium]
MFSNLALPILLAIFAAAAGVVWRAGDSLANTTDVLDDHFGLGQALGGLVLLAVATNLPEIAITVSAALNGQFDIAVGNILGGIAIQTAVLAILDAVGMRGGRPLTARLTTLIPLLEAVGVVAVLILAIMATRLPPTLQLLRLTPGAVAIAVTWLLSLWLINKARTALPWQLKNPAADKEAKKPSGNDEQATMSTGRAIGGFVLAAGLTLVAGAVLEQAGEAIAQSIGMTGVLFGSTVLAAATALPELSTGLTAVRAGSYELAVSDIFGGNAFLPVLFLVAELIGGQAILPHAHNSDIYLAGLGILLTTVYMVGLLFHSRKRPLHMGSDSLVVVILYIVGIVGLVFVPGG